MLYCISGHVKLSVNLNEYKVSSNHLVFTTPGNILKVAEVPEGQDLKPLINDGITLMETPVIGLDEDKVKLMAQYLSLMAQVVVMKGEYKNNALRSLVSSMFCTIAGVWREKMEEARNTVSHSTSRSRMIFEQFIKLVSEYHTKYRNVGFYADKLCLTPKYLSKLIKTASGMSAPEWIDAYVILEAKNLLKYSDITIKEIVYRLNFPNQSVFYKFFKARTGMTPSEYRAS